MERKQVTYRVVLLTRVLLPTLLTLLFLGCDSGQVTANLFHNQDYMQRLTQVIYELGKAMEREHCLSAVVLSASDANHCFDCHDMIERK